MERADAEAPEVAVVGGGPAGLAAAEVLAEAFGRTGPRVVVYERMPSPGRKLLIAGRGGLNLTHTAPLPAFLDAYHPAHAGLRAAVEAYPPQALRAWCADLGQPTFVGSSGRVFPESFKASPLLRAWLARLAGLGVTIRTRHRLVGLDGDSLHFETPGGPVRVAPRAGLLALGGASWPRLGSDGSWTGLLAPGSPVTPLRPANVGFTVVWSDHFATRFAGAPLNRVALRLDGAPAPGLLGEAVVTAEGIEGGAVYALGRAIRERIAAQGSAVLVIDLRPDLDGDGLARRLARPMPGASLSNRLRKAAGLAPAAAGLLREAHGRTLPEAPAALAARIKAVPLTLLEPAPLARAISTAGGLAFAGLDEAFMLRARPGLFAAGEMLDWEAPTGGYLLQGAFATGRAAAAGLLGWLARADA